MTSRSRPLRPRSYSCILTAYPAIVGHTCSMFRVISGSFGRVGRVAQSADLELLVTERRDEPELAAECLDVAVKNVQT